MSPSTLSFVLISAVAFAGPTQTPPDSTPRKIDSGRYAFDGTCRRDGKFPTCRLVVRDLVYDTVLAEPELSTLRHDDGGGLGRGFAIDSNPALGKPHASH